MDHKIIFPQALTNAVMDAFGGVYHLPQAISSDDSLYGLDGILSTIYLKGDIVGKVSLFMKSESAAHVIAAMLNVDELAPESAETLDGVGELLNMVAGRLKTRLDEHHLRFEISVPSTRLTSVISLGKWENNLEQIFSADGTSFKVLLSYRLASKEDTAPPPATAQVKLKLSAAELLKAALFKKKS